MLNAADPAGSDRAVLPEAGSRLHDRPCAPEQLLRGLRRPGKDIRIPHVLELTLVRNDRFVPVPGPLATHPHPLGVSRNLSHEPPLFLSDAWCAYDRPLASRVKIGEDSFDYRDALGGFSPSPSCLAFSR